MADSNKKPRIRKIETKRTVTEKKAQKAVLTADKSRKRRLGRAVSSAARPIKAAVKPLNVRPVKFVGRWVGRILAPRYFRNAFKEVRQVTWPSGKQTWKLTFAVLIFAVVFGAFITLADFGFDKVIRRIVLR